jgi:tryptophan 7-halogenase
LTGVRQTITQICQGLPTHDEFIARHCRAEPLG